MPVDVVPYSDQWPLSFDRVAQVLGTALADVPSATVEHVGSTSVPGLAAKPVIDVDVIVDARDVPAAVAALEVVGYTHRGDLGVTGREAFTAPDDDPRRCPGRGGACGAQRRGTTGPRVGLPPLRPRRRELRAGLREGVTGSRPAEAPAGTVGAAP